MITSIRIAIALIEINPESQISYRNALSCPRTYDMIQKLHKARWRVIRGNIPRNHHPDDINLSLRGLLKILKHVNRSFHAII